MHYYITSAKNAETLQRTMNEDLVKIEQWLAGNGLQLNADKTVYMLFKEDLKIGDSTLKKVSKTKYLGVFIDENLSWDEHIKYIDSKVNPLIGALRRSGKIRKQTALLIYNSYV